MATINSWATTIVLVLCPLCRGDFLIFFARQTQSQHRLRTAIPLNVHKYLFGRLTGICTFAIIRTMQFQTATSSIQTTRRAASRRRSPDLIRSDVHPPSWFAERAKPDRPLRSRRIHFGRVFPSDTTSQRAKVRRNFTRRHYFYAPAIEAACSSTRHST
jgi:hypothetical protein